MKFYQLISENLTELGGPMGTERTHNNYIRHFKDDYLNTNFGIQVVLGSALRKAKNFAEHEYGKKIEWVKTKEGWRSPDLLHVMFHINEIIFH
jgi:hypothetical protein